jgi:hypothetical protein
MRLRVTPERKVEIIGDYGGLIAHLGLVVTIFVRFSEL